ncbi:MAG: Zn-finger-containing protein [Actinomycetia bacterium]|jgi:uncharacterized UBP type Zn finger protein|nr:Zn-finger-containing protein [Actinomycetes bacterium]MDQ1462631.1 hypothetical protein [Actinomycetota bacterium]
MSTRVCSHLGVVDPTVEPRATGCEECLAIGSTWLHLRMCMTCGHIGCCDSSPHRHARAHWRDVAHPIVQSYEPGEDWWWCYDDDVMFFVDGVPSYAHP